jgi:phage repressor protein C with HTH and peptisase S24 domain
MNLSERIARAVRDSGLSQKDIAARVRVSPGAITQWKKGEIQSLKANNLLALAKATGVNPEWLANGTGEMKGEAEGRPAETWATTPEVPAGSSIRVYETPEDLDPDSYVWIDRYDINLSAGCGNLQWVVNQKDPISFRARWFQVKRLNPKDCKALYVRGRSMEPKLEDWDTVLIDTAQTEIIDGEIYAVCLQDEFFIKTVERIAGGVKLKSENPDFDSIEVRGEELGALRIIGKKVWRGG